MLPDFRLKRPQGLCLLVAGLCLGLGLAGPALAEPAHKHKKPAATQQKKVAKSTKSSKTTKKPVQKAANGSRKNPGGTKKVNTAEMQSAQSDLTAVQGQIRAARQQIKLTQAERDQKEGELRQAEEKIGLLKKELRANGNEAKQRQQALQELALERRQREADKERQLKQLRADVQSGYRRGGQDYFKLALNQEEPNQVARQLKYYAYIQQARSEVIRGLDKTLQEIRRIESEEKANLEKLGLLQNNLQKQQVELAEVQETREQAVNVLNAQLESQDEQLKRLLRDQAALQNLMQKLEQQAREEAKREREREAARKAEQERLAREREKAAQQAGKPLPKPVEKPVEKPAQEERYSSEPDYAASSYSGRCPLPVAGGIQSSFGSPRAGGLRWNGVLIAAPSGTAVRAIKAGRVVYADYLRGYGFLIILDHGHGLMSLYGQNQSLLKGVGDTVAANESVALVGASGGNSSAGLYFEIRVRGRPSNPTAWCGY